MNTDLQKITEAIKGLTDRTNPEITETVQRAIVLAFQIGLLSTWDNVQDSLERVLSNIKAVQDETR